MNKYILILLLNMGFTHNLMYSQTNNLILNPSFEEADTCPMNARGVLAPRGGPNRVHYWDCAGPNTSDYFHVCGKGPEFGNEGVKIPYNFFGYQLPHTGYAYVGSYGESDMRNPYREYLQGTLRKPLVAGQVYAFQVFLSRSDVYGSECVSNFGVVLSDTAIYYPIKSVLIQRPNWRNPADNFLIDSFGWQKMEGLIYPYGGEQFIIFGIIDSSQYLHRTNCLSLDTPDIRKYFGYYVDDMALIDTSEVDTVRMCVHDSLFLNGGWRKGPGMYTSTVAGLPVRHYLQPVMDTSHVTVVRLPIAPTDSVLAGYVWMKTDSILVLHHPSSTGCDSTVYYVCGNAQMTSLPTYLQIPIYVQTLLPTENWYVEGLQPGDVLRVWDVQGRSYEVRTLSKNQYEIEGLNEGMYFYHVYREGKIIKQGKFLRVE